MIDQNVRSKDHIVQLLRTRMEPFLIENKQDYGRMQNTSTEIRHKQMATDSEHLLCLISSFHSPFKYAVYENDPTEPASSNTRLDAENPFPLTSTLVKRQMNHMYQENSVPREADQPTILNSQWWTGDQSRNICWTISNERKHWGPSNTTPVSKVNNAGWSLLHSSPSTANASMMKPCYSTESESCTKDQSFNKFKFN